MEDDETPCEGLTEGVQCISGMLYEDGCQNVFCNGACKWAGFCTDPRHDKKDEKDNVQESQA
jgi:hypothetical protein